MGSLPTFAALANEISVKPEGERRHCGPSCRLLLLLAQCCDCEGRRKEGRRAVVDLNREKIALQRKKRPFTAV